jgi:hypothetical protein
MAEAKFEVDHFLCGECGADLQVLKIGASARNVSISGMTAKGPCGHVNTVSYHRA